MGKQVRSKWLLLAVTISGLLVVVVWLLVWRFNKGQQAREQTELNWQDRIVFQPEHYRDPYLLRSANMNGSQVINHRLVCDGAEVASVSEMVRSVDGTLLAFVLPGLEMREKDKNWIQEYKEQKRERLDWLQRPYLNGEIYFFDLANGECVSTGLSSDNMYKQRMAFSPDGRYLAYVQGGLNIFDLETEEVRGVTSHQGSAHYPLEITGPLVWNKQSDAVYMSVHNMVLRGESGWLIKAHIQSNGARPKKRRYDAALNDGEGGYVEIVDYEAPDPNEKKLVELPPLIFQEKVYSDLDPFTDLADPRRADDPTNYAISPDETMVVVDEGGKVVVKSLDESSDGPVVVYDRIGDCTDQEAQGYPAKLHWTSQGEIFFETSCCGCASSGGRTWASRNLEKAVRVCSHDYSLNYGEDKMVCNHDFFGDYYIPYGEPEPSGYVSAGHKYDAIELVDLVSGEETRLSGDNEMYGWLVKWFY